LMRRENYKETPRPAVILLDLNMPKLSGDEVLKMIRNNDELRHIPVVVLSNSMNKKDAIKIYGLGGNSFIRKPAGYKELREFVQTFSKYWLEYSTVV
jgi:CheY-like chemotaxis protein